MDSRLRGNDEKKDGARCAGMAKSGCEWGVISPCGAMDSRLRGNDEKKDWARYGYDDERGRGPMRGYDEWRRRGLIRGYDEEWDFLPRVKLVFCVIIFL